MWVRMHLQASDSVAGDYVLHSHRGDTVLLQQKLPTQLTQRGIRQRRGQLWWCRTDSSNVSNVHWWGPPGLWPKLLPIVQFPQSGWCRAYFVDYSINHWVHFPWYLNVIGWLPAICHCKPVLPCFLKRGVITISVFILVWLHRFIFMFNM